MSILKTLFGHEARTSTPQWFVDWALNGRRAASGEVVTASTALSVSAWFDCVQIIATDTAKLPLDVYRREGGDRIPVDDHRVEYLLNVAPNDEMSALSCRECITGHAAGLGNGYGEIGRDGGGRAGAIWPLDPTTVRPKRSERGLVYEVTVGGITTVLLAEDVIHLHGLGGDGVMGYYMLELAREVLGSALAEGKFVGGFYANGAHMSGVLQHPGVLTPEAMERLRSSWVSRHGGASNAGSVGILEQGMEYKPLTVDPEKAQLVETRMFTVEDICRYFRMQPHKVGHLKDATYSNIEQQSLEYVTDTLMPWLLRWEQELKRKLFSAPAERKVYIKHNVSALLRGDAASRAAFYSSMRQNAVMSVNEIRSKEDLNSIGAAGDLYYQQANMIELGKEPEPPAPPAPAPDGQDGAEGPPDAQDDEEPRAAGVRGAGVLLSIVRDHVPSLAGAIERVLRLERDRAAGAEKRGSLSGWADEFYAGHGAHVMEALRAPLESFSDTARLFGICVTPDMEAVAARHVRRSYAEVQDAGHTGIGKGRAVEQARAELKLMLTKEHTDD